MVSRNHEASAPLLNSLCRKKRCNARDQRVPTRIWEAHQEQSRVCPRRVAPEVRKVQILGDQKALNGLCSFPHFFVGTSCQMLPSHSIDIMPECGEFGD
jgi:hypothetical protein